VRSARLRPGQPLDVDLLELAGRVDCAPDELERRLLRWHDQCWLRYDGAARDADASDVIGPPFLERVRRYVDDHLDAELGIDTLAGVAQLSRAHFVRRFAEAAAVPPSRYVLGRRLERARRLLLATDGSVAGIARATGFGSANYFGKVLRRAYGIAPGEFRASRNRAEA